MFLSKEELDTRVVEQLVVPTRTQLVQRRAFDQLTDFGGCCSGFIRQAFGVSESSTRLQHSQAEVAGAEVGEREIVPHQRGLLFIRDGR